MAAAGAAWEEGWWGEPGTSATACTHHSHAMGTGICLRYGDWQQPGQHRRSQRLPLSPKKLSGGGDGSQPVPALAPTSPGLAPPLAPWISNQWDCSQSSAFSCCHPHEGQEHRTPAPTPLSPPPPGSVFLHLLDTAAPALCRAPCSRAGAGESALPAHLPSSFASPEEQVWGGMHTAPQQSTFRRRRRKRRRNPSKQA